MLRLSQLLIRNLYKSISAYMGNPVSLQGYKRATMDPYLNACYSQNNAAAMCDIPFNAAPGNSFYCPSHAYDATYVKTNVCTTANCLSGNQAFDKQKYKTIRKWKKCGRGKRSSFLIF